MQNRWLARSGQRWKVNGAVITSFIGVIFLLSAIVGPRRWAAFGMMLAFFSFTANTLLPLFVRCAVCGLQMENSSFARNLARDQRLSWIESLDACPVCGDDGSATPASRDRWRHSGMPQEKTYWSAFRILLAAGATLLFLSGVIAVASRYRVH